MFTVGHGRWPSALTTWWLVAPLADRHGLAARGSSLGSAIPLVLRHRADPGDDHVRPDQHAAGRADPGRPAVRRAPQAARWPASGIGLATALKLFPGIFIVYLLVTRRWRAARGGQRDGRGRATLLAAAVAPRASWQFWTDALWATDRVGRTDYTGNQSLHGPAQPAGRAGASRAGCSGCCWSLAVAGYGLWRAAARRAAPATRWPG